MTTPAVGQPFPAFSLSDAQGQPRALAEFRGQYVVLYAYPKDDTPGCTAEACDFRDSTTLKAHGAAILGVSADDQDSHTTFAEKYGLPFPLLSDPGAAYLSTIGAYGEKHLYGKVVQGIKRQTFLIDPEGRLVKAWLAVKVDGHADAVAAAIDRDRAQQAERRHA